MEEIDIKKVIREKSPRLAKFVPWFVTNYLKKIIHQDEFNGILARFGDLQGTEFIREGLAYKGFSYYTVGLDKLNPDGRFIFASNHPLGGLDGVMLADAINSRFDDVKIVVNDILMGFPPLRPLFVPINKHGAQHSDTAREINNMYLSNSPIVYFPAGLCSRKIKGKITDLEWKKSFVGKAIESKRDIVPVFVGGRNSNWFYNLANLRRLLHIPFNIEMLYLVDEMFRQRQNRIPIIFGDPIPYADLQNGATHKQWAEKIKGMVYSLENKT